LGGLSLQAFALTGDATRTDPACALTPDHALITAAISAADLPPPAFVYRGDRVLELAPITLTVSS